MENRKSGERYWSSGWSGCTARNPLRSLRALQCFIMAGLRENLLRQQGFCKSVGDRDKACPPLSPLRWTPPFIARFLDPLKNAEVLAFP